MASPRRRLNYAIFAMSSSAHQLDLSGIESGWEILTVDTDRKAGRFTAAALDKNAEKRDLVIAALAEGLAIRRIASALGISVNTVLAAKRIFGDKIETEKQRLGRDCFDVMRMAVERIRDEMQDMPRASLPIIAGIMADKGLLLTGAPTSIVAHTGGPTVASVAEYINSLPAVGPVAAQENNAQKGVVIDLAIEASKPAGDSRSLDSCPPTQQAAPGGTESGQIDPKKEPDHAL